MIRPLTPEVLKIRAQFLKDVREFFHNRGYLEVETPLLNPTGTFEPFLDPFVVKRQGIRKGPLPEEESPHSSTQGYLITSPEYNLKIVLKESRQNLFQIAHTFREGDRGEHHSEEFLMLEWYRLHCDEFSLMDETEELLRFLASRPYSRVALPSPAPFPRRAISELFSSRLSCTTDRESLLRTLKQEGLLSPQEDPESWRYEELFFLLFLNRVEDDLGREGPEFVHSYPPPLAALSRIEEGVARRFEIYWNRVELANGYFELKDPEELRSRFEEENRLRRELGKSLMETDEQFLKATDPEFPDYSGIALGLDRLLMVLLGKERLREVSPFY